MLEHQQISAGKRLYLTILAERNIYQRLMFSHDLSYFDKILAKDGLLLKGTLQSF